MSNNRRAECGALQDTPIAWADLFVQEVYGRLTVQGYTGCRSSHGQKKITCRCICGMYIDVMPTALRNGMTTSCGCLTHDRLRVLAQTHSWRHGGAAGGHAPLYRRWRALKERDRRGEVAFAPVWRDDYPRFAQDIRTSIGDQPPNTWLVRIDTAAGFAPGNVQWETKRVSTRSAAQHALKERARQHKVPLYIVRGRLKLGWTLEAATTTPFVRLP